jgi:tetratricopeptide (TPR) repeat protein
VSPSLLFFFFELLAILSAFSGIFANLGVRTNLLMRKFACFILLLFPALACFSQQQAAAADSMKKALANSKTTGERVEVLDALSRIMMNVNQKEADQYGQQLINEAEESRDRRLMIKAYMSNGTRCSYFAGTQNYTSRAIDYFNQALAIAKQNKYDDAVGAALLKLSTTYLFIPDKDKALNYVNQAFSIISTLDDDSLKSEAHNVSGHVYLARNEKTLALRNYLNGLRIAEDRKATKSNKASLIRSCYTNLSAFYSDIEDYDRAIDYYTKALKKLDEIDSKNAPYQRAMDINSLGRLYSAKNSHDIAISYYERSLVMADSLKFSTLKIPAYVSLLNEYLRIDQPRKALEYLNSKQGQALVDFLNNFGLSGASDQSYAVIYTELGKYDSAHYYFAKAEPYFEKSPSEITRMTYYAQLAPLYQKTGDNKKAIELYLKVKAIAEKLGQLESAERAAKHLDTLYTRTGNFQEASHYSSIYYKYKDSVGTLNKEKELAQIDAADEQQRVERQREEELEKERQRDNIQYIGIVIGIVVIFILLVIMGMFKVSATTIKMIGFFAFLMFFEFIFLIFKKNIHSLTHGEPMKDLLFMIGLAAVLLPLHHWLEHKVIHYLTSHNRLTAAGHHIKRKLFRRSGTGER